MTAERARNQLDTVPGGDMTQVVLIGPAKVVPRQQDPGLLDALALASKYADEVVVSTARDTHKAIADRAFGIANKGTLQSARLPQALHNGLSSSVYSSLSAMLRLASLSLTRLGAAGVGPRLSDTVQGRSLQSAVNGLIGERLREEHAHLAVPMSVRSGSRDVVCDRPSLRKAFPEATNRIVVFVHGLGEHEGFWEHRRYEMGGTYGSRLAAMASWTPVYLRVNTGLSVAENGVELTALMQRLVDNWPTPVRRIALVGHSLGGLIIRAGCAVGTGAALPWTERVSDVITLGTPHLGADLAKGVRAGSGMLSLVPETAAFARILEERSVGIRDLERGLPELPPLPHVRYRLVSAEIGAERGPLGWLLGDLLVRAGSAQARSRKTMRLFPDADVLHVPNSDHFSLLNHPDVFTAMKEWLA